MKEKSFAQELAELINRHGIDAKMNTNDWILADVAVDALNAYGKANQLREKMANAPEPGKDDCDCPACTLRRALQGKAQPGGKEYRKPEAFDVPKEVEAMAAFFADMFPGSEIQIQRVDLKRTPGTNAGPRINGKEGDAMKNKCSSEIPNMPTGCAPDNRRPEKICGTCRYFNPEFPVNGKPAPVCLAIKEMKGGTEYTNPRGTQHYFRCSNGRYENGIGQ